MNNDVELEGRPRPLSTGLWTLFSWLRRDDRSSSSESLSSAGSDRTVASFAFLTPARYQPATTPLVLPPPGPPTDSYKKRVHDRNLRRQYDRDLTLHRKYGLIKSGDTSSTYDASSLPPVRRINSEGGSRWDRDRRATSECYQRRLAYVPGKRRAPLPPVSTVPSCLTRRSTRKRRAPQPPVKSIEKNKENIISVEVTRRVPQMNSQSIQVKQNVPNSDVTMGCKSEKYSKKEGCSKETKIKPEKSFLKQIFDSKKRNSGIDISSVKLLPSISELDKQAAEMIETCKLNAEEQNVMARNTDLHTPQTETWICVSCLKKYNASLITCPRCLPNQKVNASDRSNRNISMVSKAASSSTQTEKNLPNSVPLNKNDEKQKLKEMLKEMKDSLPKRPKHDFKNQLEIKPREISAYSNETPTLRVGSTVQKENKVLVVPQSSTTDMPKSTTKEPNISIQKQSSVSLQPPGAMQILSGNKKHSNVNMQTKELGVTKTDAKLVMNIQKENIAQSSCATNAENNRDKKDLHTPLKISSLLNPIYIPKIIDTNKANEQPVLPSGSNTEKPTKEILINSNKVLQSKGNSTASKNGLVGPSKSETSRLPISVNKIEIRPTPEAGISSIEPQANMQNEKLASEQKVADKGGEVKRKEDKSVVASIIQENNNMYRDLKKQDQHSRRRELIHQLEQSIARGDELAAAEAAAKLAQLRLSCSVLSFSSQILSQPSTSKSGIHQEAQITPNKRIANINVSEKIKKDTEHVQFTSVQERSPQKNITQKFKSNADLDKTRLPSPSLSNAEPVKEKAVQKNKDICGQKIDPVYKAPNPTTKLNDNKVTIAVLVEDREATRGPVHLRIQRLALMRDLRREAETSLGLATNLQRWIVGRVLCVNDNTPIIALAGPDFSAPFYLCVVESETKSDQTIQTKVVEKKSDLQTTGGNVYTELVQLEQQSLVPNTEVFECGVCMEEYPPGRGIVLRECVHIFCRDCLCDVVRHCEEPDVACPAMGCPGMLQEREIRALVTPQDYERWLARGLAAAESGTRNAFHCRTRDCKGWALCDPGVQKFPCPVCKHINCVPCQAIHEGKTCEEYQAKLKQTATANNANPNETDDGTRTLLNALIAKGEALECPECSAIITKKWGCDWVKCSACKTEICWVTRGRRWGPGGKGDTSGGCRCGVDGKRCHPSCGYCH